jgi:DNA helicase II / ATP-dependent DNA helicase PcrA
MEEERRLAYVGITRAKDRLYLTRAFRRSNYGYEELTLPSRFLKDIPPNLIEDRTRQARGTNFSSGVARSAGLAAAPRPTTPPPAAPKSARYQVGTRVYHPKFGEGTIVGVETSSSEEYVQVAFPGAGIKKLAASIAPLEKR